MTKYKQSKLERTFSFLLRTAAPDIPEPTPEHHFHPVRMWRLDMAWPEYMVGVELDGGTYSQGRHTRGKGYEGDCWKLNTAAILGWTVLRFTSSMLESKPDDCFDQLRDALGLEMAPRR